LLLFHRRLLALALVFLGVLGILVLRVSELTIVQGSHRLEKAKGRLYRKTYLPTWRGSILDAKGRVLAEDVPTFDVAVPWDLITGDRAKAAALAHAKRSVDREVWNSISPDERQKLKEQVLPRHEEELTQFWELLSSATGVPLVEIEQRAERIKQHVNKTAEVVWQRQEEAHVKRYGSIEDFKQQPILEQRSSHVLFPAVADALAMDLTQLSMQLDDALEVRHARHRSYPALHQTVLLDRSTLPRPLRENRIDTIELLGVGELLLGDIRQKVWAQDIERRPFNEGKDLGGYRIGDQVGHRGLELSLENLLRGTRGRIVQDRHGVERERTPPVGGSNVQLTIDIALQARIEAVLAPQTGLMTVQPWHRNAGLPVGTPLRGAVVILDAESGVLAMASTPALRDEEDVEGYPWLNRAADGLYPAGSIVKPLVLAAATTEGQFGVDEEINCTGHYFENITHAARCWIYREGYNFATHGTLKAVDALARSCNIFFYELGSRLGFHSLLEWYEKFGLAQPLSARLTDVHATGSQGHTPDVEAISGWQRKGELAFETISMAIGQGPITWSPLHAAASYATLARGGVWLSPTLLKNTERDRLDLELNTRGVSLALEGLQDSLAKEYGTGSLLRFGPSDSEPIFTVDGVRLWGKTGTAEAPPYKPTHEATPIVGLDHSWFVVMASHQNETTPAVIVAVLIEHGGSGGRVAGPVANQVLHALKNEGYLEANP
jgi:penicillin-binding protein 2